MSWAILAMSLTVATLAQADEYKTGQVWEIQSGQYAGADVIIVEVEDHPVQKHVIHIAVDGPLTGPNGVSVPNLPHFPFAAEGLKVSDLRLTGTVEVLPDSWREGYDIWNAAATEGRAGIFTIPVSQVIDLIMEQLAQLEQSPPKYGVSEITTTGKL